MKRLAVIPSEPIQLYLASGHDPNWLRSYFNPRSFFDEVYLLSPKEEDNPDLLGMKVLKTEPHNLAGRIKDLKIDIVRAYGGYWACDMACNNKVNNVPVVVSVHDARISRLYDSIQKADIILCMSDTVKEAVRSKYPNENNLWLLPNRVDFEVMYPSLNSDTGDLNSRYPYKYKIMHVGRKVVEKNLSTLIKALKILGKDYCVLAIGSGDNDDYIRLAKREGVNKRCYFLQALKQTEFPRYYSWADCMCTPSLCEGFGMVFIEALACNGVVITSDIAPMNSYIQHMKNGVLVPDYQNPSALAEAIKLACTDQTLRQTLKKNARKSVEMFEKKHIDKLEASYYSRLYSMKDNGKFSIPYYLQTVGNIKNNLKRMFPLPLRQKIRNLVIINSYN